jgi:hypothetical protein
VPDGDRPSADGLPVAEPIEETSRRQRSRTRRTLGLTIVAVLCVAALAIPIAIRASGDGAAPHRKATDDARANRVDARRARVTVGAA